jgi:NADPH:quinone reductase
MRAVTISTFGGPEVVEVAEVDLPIPAAGEARIRVRAAPIQPADIAVRSGRFGPMVPPGRYTLGWDVAGVVDAVGPDVAGISVDDSVVGLSGWLRSRVGTHAEFVVLPAADLAPAPPGMPPEAAATLPANALTAAYALDLLRLAEGQTLAITGAGGAVGGYALELARLRGISVIALASAQDEAFLTERGATFAARTEEPARALRAVAPNGVDGLLDTAVLGGQVLPAVADRGVYIGVIPPAEPVAERWIRVQTVDLQPDGARLRELAALAADGRLTPRVAQTFGFDDAAKAHALAQTPGVRGRVVLVP